MKKNFRAGDFVKIVNFPPEDIKNGWCGTVVGKAFEDITDIYIVQFEHYTGTEWSCFVITEACLEKVDGNTRL